MSARFAPFPSRRSLLKALASVAACSAMSGGCQPPRRRDGKLHLVYWEKWQRFEGDAMKAVVKAFNDSQQEIVVHYVPVGLLDRKLLTATAGGDPPDLSGVWDTNVATFADRGVLTPLDPLMKRDGISRDHWIDVYADICTRHGQMWAIPTTPTTTGLHWNKALFRKSANKLKDAGYDPEQPPRTLQALDDYARILTEYDSRGNITQAGFLPQEPGWFHWAWGAWFGGTLVSDEGEITADHPLNVKAFEWLQHFGRDIGVHKINRFTTGFGNFSSPQNPFFSGKVAMIIQGVWMYNYISQYAPGMQWGVAPWPKTPTGPDRFSTAGCDVLVIPAGLPRHRHEAAWEFVKFVLSRTGMEMLNIGQRKNTPIRDVSERFIADHPHPYIQLFIEMSRYEEVFAPFDVGVWNQYQTEIFAAFEKMRLLEENPSTGQPYTAKEALGIVQQRISRAHKRHLRSLQMRRNMPERVT